MAIDIDSECVGSSFDDFLKEDGIYDYVQATAQKRVLSWMLERYIIEHKISKSELARKMQTSRSQVDRILDPDNTSITLQTIHKAASLMGKKATIIIEDAPELACFA
jgi:hypothetical protein